MELPILFIGLFIGYFIGTLTANNDWQKEAVAAGCGEWVTTSGGDVEFRWKGEK